MSTDLKPAPTPAPSAPPAGRSSGVSDFVSGLWLVATVELRQRMRGVAWWVLLGVFVVLVALVTLGLWTSLGGFGGEIGGGIFSTLIYFVLLLGTLVAPAVSGNAINGDRDAGVLATTQVTLLSTGQIVLGKFVAAWITALAFLAAAVPFLILSIFLGGVRVEVILVSILVLAVELGVVAAVGVGLSGLLTRPLFSVVVTYLVVAALSVGSLIAFGLLGLTVQSTVRVDEQYYAYDMDGELRLDADGEPMCEGYTDEYAVPRFDYFWGALAANPYFTLADAVPTEFDRYGNPTDLFGWTKVGIRSAQLPPQLERTFDECAGDTWQEQPRPTPEEIVDSTVPSWFVGLSVHVALAAGLLWAGWSATRTPTRRVARGSRVA